MKALVIRQDSLLWHLVTNYSSVSKYDKVTDLCTITSAAIKSIFMIFLIVFFASIFLLPVLWIGTPLVYWLVNDTAPYFEEVFFVGLALYGTIGAVIGIQSYWYARCNNKPTIVGEAWRSFKEKSCIRVVVE
jgi:hypothetical protein